jgi:hypothetical protein
MRFVVPCLIAFVWIVGIFAALNPVAARLRWNQVRHPKTAQNKDRQSESD